MTTPIAIGSRLELLLDDFLVERLTGSATQRLHHPVPREAALVTDQPWEGNGTCYLTVLRDAAGYRMYYRCWQLTPGVEPETACAVAVSFSDDGKHWRRPELGLYDHAGSTRNNLVFIAAQPERRGEHGFSPFVDEHPNCLPEQRYKAVGAGARQRAGIYLFGSPDGLRWQPLRSEPLLHDGAFDSQNVVFWDPQRSEYRAYFRDYRNPVTRKRDYLAGYRCVRTATSPDLQQWTAPQWLEYPGVPDEHLYTNQITTYPRAPHLFVGFPTRYIEHPWNAAVEALPELEQRRLRAQSNVRYGSAVTDGLFMSSRDGRTFKRWGEAFIRPGLRPVGNWTYGDNYQNWGIVQTASDIPGAPAELSFYLTEGYWRGSATVIRRHTLRLDGFVSVQALRDAGECLTRPFTFTGSRLLLNMSTSAAGWVRIEIQHPDGAPVPGFSLADSPAMFGDAVQYQALWKNPAALATLAGQPIRLRLVLSDADVYALQFTD